MCELLFAYMIVGAIEITPGTMRVEQLSYSSVGHTEIKILHVPTAEYLECWDGQGRTAE